MHCILINCINIIALACTVSRTKQIPPPAASSAPVSPIGKVPEAPTDTNTTEATVAAAAGSSAKSAGSLASSSTAVGLLPPPIDTSGGGSAVQPPHVPSGVPVRSPRSRPRANSKGQLGALEPIQERRRGSNTTSSLHADVAAALAAPSTVSEDEEDEDEEDRPPRSAMPPAGPDAFVVVEPAASVAMAASVGEKQSALSTLDFSSTEPPGEHTLKLAAAVAAADAATSNSGGSSPVPGQAAANRQVAGSVKSVSFSATNQTLQPDNTIRNSSTRMEIVPAAASAVNAGSQALPNISTNASDLNQTAIGPLAGGTDIEVVDQYDTAARNINARTTAAAGTGAVGGGAATADGIAVFGSAPSSAFAAPTSSLRPNLHLEMSSLANSVHMLVAQSPLGTNGTGDDNSSFAHSLSQSRMSVRNFSFSVAKDSSRVEALVASVADALAGQDENSSSATEGDFNDLQHELIEKAVVVIRRVMDKLTGLDFADGAHSQHPQHQQHQHALEVPDQVDRLIREATSNENLSQSFFGWCPFW